NIETDQAIFNIIHENHYFSPELSAFNVKCDFYFQAIFNKLLSYDKKVEFGFVADAAIVPNPKAMIDDFMEEFSLIKAEMLGAAACVDSMSEV
ncbi:WSD1 family O-acyltransferase, partial [Ketobacter sp. MCCC 1A13808]|uniref:WS/DGAT domain-containing protein n=1 Tax=Ketobacter sp. MCCC 1A13808 TaxID=2602738 RepID=UPI0012EB2511